MYPSRKRHVDWFCYDRRVCRASTEDECLRQEWKHCNSLPTQFCRLYMYFVHYIFLCTVLYIALLVLQLHTIDGRPVLSNHSASNGIVYLIEGFLNYEILTIGERIERTSYHSMFQEALTRVDLLDILTGALLYVCIKWGDNRSVTRQSDRIFQQESELPVVWWFWK